MEEPALQVLPHPGQKRRGAVEVLQGQALEPLCFHRLDPLRAGQIGAGGVQPLQRHGKSGPFQVELKLAVLGQAPDQVREPLPLPQPPKDQGRPPLPGGAGRQARFPDGLHHPEFFTKFRQALQQAVQFARGHQMVSPSQGADDLLPDLAALAVGADDLQIFVSAAPPNTTFIPHEHVYNMQILKSIVKYF